MKTELIFWTDLKGLLSDDYGGVEENGIEIQTVCELLENTSDQIFIATEEDNNLDIICRLFEDSGRPCGQYVKGKFDGIDYVVSSVNGVECWIYVCKDMFEALSVSLERFYSRSEERSI